MEARMPNPATLLPGATEGIQAAVREMFQAGVPQATMELVHQRVSQINGCAWCLNYGAKNAKQAGETDERLALVAGWREAHCYTDEEKAAFALAEAMTRLADGSGVPDDVWDAAADHFAEKQLAALVLYIAMTNLFNRVNVTTRQPANAKPF
ncbi:carboxymuconolactone decarboxylase family protein [Actinopolymorpha sp. B11F2]|uniref:carboxymuconolactone decarboxylase family protein n=1 Tax=Actinopolymorpha sp. B11F2 TaxID=3160862 RepID=UPI0032E3CF1B